MKKLSLVLIIVEFFNYIAFTLAGNNYYIISIRRNKKDKEYDEASKNVQNAIDELVNDRMNDIYDIISENEETFKLDNGKQDKKLEELESTKLMKRNGNIKKIRFVNPNRPQVSKVNENFKRSSDLIEENEEEIIEIESQLVKHVCPVLNYYTIVAYLSDEIVNEIKKLPNVINCHKTQKLRLLNTSDNQRYYDINAIKKQTHWSDVKVQEIEAVDSKFNHLSMISQGRYYQDNKSFYDTNYYYPATAGKGIDIYLIDKGLWSDHVDFDTYNGKRKITCDAIIYNGQYHSVKDKKKCSVRYDENGDIDTTYYPDHGVMVSSLAAGAIYGAAKSANIHMIASELETSDYLAALDYIKTNAKAYKTIVSISSGGFQNDRVVELEDKVKELTNNGIIVVAAAGNDGENICDKRDDGRKYVVAGYDNIISVGATMDYDGDIENGYSAASYTNFGKCVDIHAPGIFRHAYSEESNDDYMIGFGTSGSAPIVAGVIATIMSENSNVKYTNESMKKKLDSLALKNVIKNLGSSDTPNRFINNGKTSISQTFRCDDASGKYKCSSGCCSRNGVCVDIIEDNEYGLDKCLIENGCQSKFGKCSSYDASKSTTTSKERKLIITKSCEIENLKVSTYCRFPFRDETYLPALTEKQITVNCDRYRALNCKEYFKNASNFLDSCTYAKKLYNYEISIDDEEILKKDEIERNLMCARENIDGKLQMCSFFNSLYNDLFESDSELDEALLNNCKSKECYEAYYEYNEYQLEEARKYRIKVLYRDYKHRKDIMTSDECIALLPKSSTTTTTVDKIIKTTTLPKTKTTTTTTNSKKKYIPTSTVSGRCGPNYGACANPNYCCSQYNYCGKTESYCGKGCQSEFGICSASSSSPVVSTTTTKAKTTTTPKAKTTTTKKAKTTKNKKTTKKIITIKKKTAVVKSTTTTKKVPKSTVTDRCGPKYGACANAGYCCSKYDYCGKSSAHCGVGCQPAYGICK